MYDPNLLAMVEQTRQPDRRNDAARERLSRETVLKSRRRQARLAVRKPVWNLIARLGNRLAGPAPQRQIRDATGA